MTMSYRTANGTATTGNNDCVAMSGTLTFAPGETTKTITIGVKGDSKEESNETFYPDLFGNSSNSSFTKNRGIGNHPAGQRVTPISGHRFPGIEAGRARSTDPRIQPCWQYRWRSDLTLAIESVPALRA
jgi:hypothetical protein